MENSYYPQNGLNESTGGPLLFRTCLGKTMTKAGETWKGNIALLIESKLLVNNSAVKTFWKICHKSLIDSFCRTAFWY